MTNYNISIVSDTVCPWCYVGKNKLDRAIEAHKAKHPSDTFTTTWLPYYLNPTAPKVGVDKKQMYASKFGPERSAMMQQRLEGIGKENGINFSFGGKTGNTRDSHRLIELAKTKGGDTQTKLVEALFKAYFENEEDITSHDVLRAAAVKAGLEEQEAKDWLESDKGGPEVDREVKNAQMQGISGVPNFTLQGKFEIGGAQDPEAFLKAFGQVKTMEG